MKFVIAGGTGFVGQQLSRLLVGERHEVFILTRHAGDRAASAEDYGLLVQWDGCSQGPWVQTCEGADVVVNLSGASIADSRWTDKRKQELTDSRVQPTRTLLQAIHSWTNKPHTFITASGVGYYGDTGDTLVDETSGSGHGFLAKLCREWEGEALKGEAMGLRILAVRFGMVLGVDGGALPKMMFPFKLFLGGPVLPGSQYVAWIHREDLSRLILWLSENRSISSPVNGVAPEMATMRQFCAALGKAMHRPSVFPVPQLVLRIALGEMSTVLTTGQKVYPKKALEGGFSYSYPTLQSAFPSLMAHT